jgi:hypothetical protein
MNSVSLIWVFQHMDWQSFAHKFYIANDITHMLDI